MPPAPYRITELDPWSALVEADANGDGSRGPILEIRGGTELNNLPNTSREAMLATVASYGGSLLSNLEGEPHPPDLRLLRSAGAAGAETTTSILHAAFAATAQRPLRAEHLAPVKDASGRITALMLTGSSEQNATPAEIRERAQTAIDLFKVLFSANHAELEAIISALAGEPASPVNTEQADARIRLRMKAMLLRVIDESLTVAQLREQHSVSRQHLKQLRDADRLFAIDVPYRKGLLYPAWQFQSDGRPRPQMPALIAAARHAGLDALGFHLLMTGQREEGPSALEMLEEGHEERILSLIDAADR